MVTPESALEALKKHWEDDLQRRKMALAEGVRVVFERTARELLAQAERMAADAQQRYDSRVAEIEAQRFHPKIKESGLRAEQKFLESSLEMARKFAEAGLGQLETAEVRAKKIFK